MRVLIATSNEGKLREYQRLLEGVPRLVLDTMATLGVKVDVDEDLDTFEGNALKKAREVARATGLVCLADDSGLEVDALHGQPGVRSARYAGNDATDAMNNRKLLGELLGVDPEERTARFRCAIAVVEPQGRVIAATDGVCEGHIADAPRGDHGFGYDPLFVPEDHTSTMAELDPNVKNAISHRAKAAKKLVPLLAKAF